MSTSTCWIRAILCVVRVRLKTGSRGEGWWGWWYVPPTSALLFVVGGGAEEEGGGGRHPAKAQAADARLRRTIAYLTTPNGGEGPYSRWARRPEPEVLKSGHRCPRGSASSTSFSYGVGSACRRPLPHRTSASPQRTSGLPDTRFRTKSPAQEGNPQHRRGFPVPQAPPRRAS